MKKIIGALLPYFILFGLLFWALRPLFHPGFFPIHDDEQVGRLYQLDKVLHAGHFPPRLTPDLGFGYGYMLFNFYPPFVYYVAEIFHLIGFSYIVSIKLMIGLGFALAAFFMYKFCREFVGQIGAVVAAIVYSYAPYHSVDVYVRGALPEFWGFVFVPALFWSFLKLERTFKLRYFLLSSLFVAGVVLTHNLIAMMSAIFLGVFFVYLFFNSKKRGKLVLQFVMSFLLGLGISAYFWIPSFFEKKYTLINLLTRELADYNLHFVYFRQFFDSPWGYGGSLYGLFDGLSFEIGKGIWVLLGVSIVVMFFVVKNYRHNFLYYVFLALFVFSLFIQTFHSKFFWDILPPFWYIQFPWRFLLFSAFTASLVIGYGFTLKISNRVKIIAAVVIVAFVIVATQQYFRPEKYFTHATDKDYTADSVIKWRTSKMAFEYVPIGVKTIKSQVGNSVIDITPDQIATQSYQVIQGDLAVIVLKDLPQTKQFRVNSSRGGVFQVNTFAYPGWKVILDGQVVPFQDNNSLKLIQVTVPKGNHEIEAVFTDTPLRKIANIISIISLIIAMMYAVVNLQHGHKKK